MKSDGLDDLRFQWIPITIRNRKSMPQVFILGADDPEMTEIENILILHGKQFQYATRDGYRVHPGNAYKADSVAVQKGFVAVLVECEPEDITGFYELPYRIDHHRLGDRGFNYSSEFYWEASSIGQLYHLLGLGTPTKEHLTLAALDHCMVAARRGKCPGVDPELLKMFSRKHIAARKGIDIYFVEECITEMIRQVRDSPITTIGTQKVVDLTSLRMGTGYSLEYLSALEALADTHKVALIRTKNRKGHPDKVILCGAATRETIRFFIEIWAPANGLINIYGVPERGYAGGYKE